MPRYTEGESPSVGDIKGKYILVCHGDDKPQEWIDWLEPFAKQAEELISLAEEYGVDLTVQTTTDKQTHRIDGMDEFLDVIGVTRDGYAWGGFLISGYYHLGWVKVNRVEAVKSEAMQVLGDMARIVQTAIAQK